MTAPPAQHSSGAPYGTLPVTALKEQLSLAYVQAVATAAACSVDEWSVDYSGVDVTIRQDQPSHSAVEFPELNLQLKCTSAERLIHPTYLSWQLDRRKHDLLRATKLLVPRILVVMQCPEDFTTWVHQDDERLTMSHAAYWTSLRGEEAIPADKENKTVHIPRSQPFNVAELLGIMSRIGGGGTP